MTWLLVALGGAAGALTRYGLMVLVGPRSFPATTLGINVSGSFLLGLLLTLAASGRISTNWVTALGVGLLGGYTTYSTFSWEVLALLREDRWLSAGLYLVMTVVLALVAAALGHRLGLALRG